MMAGRESPQPTDKDFVIDEVTDLDQVWPELRQLFLDLHEYHEPWQSRVLRDDWEERWRAFVQPGPDSLVLLAVQESKVVGYLCAQIRRDYGLFDETVGFLNEIYVVPNLRGTGIGRALLEHCESWCSNRGSTQLDLTVLAGNRAGFDFWTHSGFSPISFRMSKPLEVPA